MNKKDISRAFRKVGNSLSKHSPEILAGIGIAGMVTTVVLAVKATPRAVELLEEKKKAEELEELKPIDVVKTTWKEYIPAATTGALSIACVVGGTTVSVKRSAALATAYKISEAALSRYKEAVIETVGEKKEELIRGKAAKKELDENPIKEESIINTGKGNTRFYDPYSGRYFYSTTEALRRAELACNKKLLRNDFLSLNEWYYEIGLLETLLGGEIGWSTFVSRHKYGDTDLDLTFTAQVDEDDQPTMIIEFRNAPKYRFEDIWDND